MATREPPRDDLKQSLGRALDHDRAKRHRRGKSQATGPKKSKASIEQQGSARSEVNKLVSKQAQRNGDYQFMTVEFVEVTEGGKRIKKERKVVRNVGATPVERWISKGHLDERQAAAILFYQEAFRKVFGQGPRVSANYSPGIGRGYLGSVELWASSGIAAKESLRLLDQEVFFRLPLEHFHVWQNVVIWDQAAGVAGGAAGYVNKPAEAVAKEIVKTIAKMIADIVIDSSRNDFGDLILDLDAPRRAGRKATG